MAIALIHPVSLNMSKEKPEETLVRVCCAKLRMVPFVPTALQRVSDRQATPLRSFVVPEVSVCQVPSQKRIVPLLPTARQNEDDRQKILFSSLFKGFVGSGPPQPEISFHVRAFPSAPTALQNEVVGQETLLREAGPEGTSTVQVVPFKSRIIPSSPTALQREDEKQEIAFRFCVVGNGDSKVQVAPSQVKIIPVHPTATQKFVVGQETLVRI